MDLRDIEEQERKRVVPDLRQIAGKTTLSTPRFCDQTYEKI